MRQIDWKNPLSDDDKAWLRQRGNAETEDMISANERKFLGMNDDDEDDEKPPEYDDDYDKWKIPELATEAKKRNLDITGLSKKPDLIAALRTWDAANPEG